MHILPLQSMQPQAIIPQHALATRWKIRNTLLHQLGIIAQHRLDILYNPLAHLVIRLAHCAFLMRPCRILFRRAEHPLCRTPEHKQPKPLGVKRHMIQKIVLPLWHIRVIMRIGLNPGRRALKHKNLACLLCNLWHKLKGTRARTNHPNALIRQIAFSRPSRRMKCNPPILLAPRNIRQLWAIELPHGTDNSIRLERLTHTVFILHLNFPDLALFIKTTAHNLRAKPDMLAQAKIHCKLFEIIEKHLLRRKILRPIPGHKRIGIRVIRTINAASGIRILEPCPPHIGILFHHNKRNPRLLKPMRRQQPGHPRPNNQNPKLPLLIPGQIIHPRRHKRIFPIQRQLPLQKRPVIFGNLLPNHKIHHLPNPRSARCRWQSTTAIPIGLQHLKSDLPDNRLLFRCHTRLRIRQIPRPWTNLSPNNTHISGQMHQRNHQRGNIRIFQRRPDRLVIFNNRSPCIKRLTSHRPSPLTKQVAAPLDPASPPAPSEAAPRDRPIDSQSAKSAPEQHR